MISQQFLKIRKLMFKENKQFITSIMKKNIKRVGSFNFITCIP